MRVRLIRQYALIVLAALACAPAARAADPEDQDARRARAYFHQSAAWVAAGSKPLAAIRDVYADLQDVKIRDERQKHEGHMRIWLAPPERLRWEIRSSKDSAARPRVLTKVLDGGKMWIHEGKVGSTWERMHGNADNPGAVAQLQADRDRFASLARFLTLSDMEGAGVVFEDQGVFERPEGHHLAGRWLKVRRVEPGGGTMAFLLAFREDAAGARVATWPGAVLVPGDAKSKRPTEHYVLKQWKTLRGRRVPARVERWTGRSGGEGLDRTLLAFVADLRINAGIPAERFRPPAPKSHPDGKR